jgi:oligo-1,6-glucosidase
VMDLVVNHTSDKHPWFIESRSSADNPKRDWYWWRPAREGMTTGAPGAEPNNWESFFSGSVWELDEATGEYYLHLFSRRQPDLNWENPEVRAAVYKMMTWWLDKGIDGFRMDVINMISKDVELPDGHVMGPSIYGDGSPYFLNGPRIHEFLQEMHGEVFAGRGTRLLTVGEMPGVTVDEALLYTDPARHELDMVFQFEHMDVDHVTSRFDTKPLNLLDLKASLGRWQAGLADVGWNSLYWNNHDQPRVVSRFGNDDEYRVESAKMLGTVLHMHRGTPYVYQGEEIGMTNMSFSSRAEFQDIQAVNFYQEALKNGTVTDDLVERIAVGTRDNARTPMQWDNSEKGGFTTGVPWFPVNPNTSEINVAAARADEGSVFHHYRALIALRHEHPVVALGDFHMLLERDPNIYAFTRSLEGVELLVLGNFSSDVVVADVPDAHTWASAELLLGNYNDVSAETSGIALRPWEARIYRREHAG